MCLFYVSQKFPTAGQGGWDIYPWTFVEGCPQGVNHPAPFLELPAALMPEKVLGSRARAWGRKLSLQESVCPAAGKAHVGHRSGGSSTASVVGLSQNTCATMGQKGILTGATVHSCKQLIIRCFFSLFFIFQK